MKAAVSFSRGRKLLLTIDPLSVCSSSSRIHILGFVENSVNICPRFQRPCPAHNGADELWIVELGAVFLGCAGAQLS